MLFKSTFQLWKNLVIDSIFTDGHNFPLAHISCLDPELTLFLSLFPWAGDTLMFILGSHPSLTNGAAHKGLKTVIMLLLLICHGSFTPTWSRDEANGCSTGLETKTTSWTGVKLISSRARLGVPRLLSDWRTLHDSPHLQRQRAIMGWTRRLVHTRFTSLKDLCYAVFWLFKVLADTMVLPLFVFKALWAILWVIHFQCLGQFEFETCKLSPGIN